MIIFKDIEQPEVKKLSKAIIKCMEDAFVFEDVRFNLTLSIGITSFQVGCNQEDVIENSKQAMYQAKKNGGNTYYIG